MLMGFHDEGPPEGGVKLVPAEGAENGLSTGVAAAACGMVVPPADGVPGIVVEPVEVVGAGAETGVGGCEVGGGSGPKSLPGLDGVGVTGSPPAPPRIVVGAAGGGAPVGFQKAAPGTDPALEPGAPL